MLRWLLLELLELLELHALALPGHMQVRKLRPALLMKSPAWWLLKIFLACGAQN